jgi:hypothetical protein
MATKIEDLSEWGLQSTTYSASLVEKLAYFCSLPPVLLGGMAIDKPRQALICTCPLYYCVRTSTAVAGEEAGTSEQRSVAKKPSVSVFFYSVSFRNFFL